VESRRFLQILSERTPEIVRIHGTPLLQLWGGIPWAVEPKSEIKLSAYGCLAWAGRYRKPAGAQYEWTGNNLLCNAAPTPFSVGGERFASVDNFYHALKLPEGMPERLACSMASFREAKHMTRHFARSSFLYAGKSIEVGSLNHAALIAEAICSKISENKIVQTALLSTQRAKLAFRLPYTRGIPNVLGLITPFVLMVERWKLRHSN
jgi:predicted NAD-dependent protein-ADP-ribosyltransferase YbiA (DUF1768 family)